MKRAAILAGMIVSMLVPGVASGAALVPIADGDTWGSEPIFATAPPNDQRVFVVERGADGNPPTPGVIRVAENGAVKTQPFLTIDGIDQDGERGLLSMAFAPDYSVSGLFYVFYTAPGGAIQIVEYKRSDSDPDVADPGSARLVLSVPHPSPIHNGGWIGFGPDDMLYITIGDSGNMDNSQTTANLLGKVSRIDPADPDGGGPLTATIPPDNPFAGNAVYTLGLRNPFRASFAPNGDLTIGDVGAGSFEEINAGDLRGKNLGWPECEGVCETPDPDLTDPVFAYSHEGSTDCAVLGGHVVRDPDLTGLTGRYIYGDLCATDLRTLNLGVAGADPFPAGLDLGGDRGTLRSFGEDSRGCSYVVTTRSVYRIAAGPGAGADCPRTAPPPDPPPPGPTPDVNFNFFIAKKRSLAKRLFVAGKCSIGCDLKATGKIRVGRNRFQRRPRRINLRAVTARGAAGKRTPLTLKVSGKSLRQIRKAARRGSRIVAFVKVTARADDGSGGSGSGPIRLVRAKRR